MTCLFRIKKFNSEVSVKSAFETFHYIVRSCVATHLCSRFKMLHETVYVIQLKELKTGKNIKTPNIIELGLQS